MKKLRFLLAILAAALVFGLVSCGGDGGSVNINTGDGGNYNNPGGSSYLQGNGVVWEQTLPPGGSGFIFRDGFVYIAVKNGNTWYTGGTAYASYNATHILSGREQMAYSVSGNILTIEYHGTTYTRRTGQAIHWV